LKYSRNNHQQDNTGAITYLFDGKPWLIFFSSFCSAYNQEPLTFFSLPYRNVWIIGSQSAPYGAPGLPERNLGVPRTIRFFCFYF